MPASPVIGKAASIAFAVAAVAVLGFTALRGGGGSHTTPRPSTTPSAGITLPGSVDVPSYSPPPAPATSAGKDRLKVLAGKWVLPSNKNSYFRFRGDGLGEWVVAGRTLWNGQARVRDEQTYDLLSDGQGASYMQVKLVHKNAKLFFTGNQQTFVKT